MNRKDEHLALAKAFFKEQANDFDAVRFVHHSFAEVAVTDIDLSTNIQHLHLSSPFFINAMTGGSQKTAAINQQLASLARETGLLMATGSVSAALTNPAYAASFQIVRKENPQGLILANIGADRSLEDAKRAVDLVQADGLQIHLNVPQELLMPEGNRDFYGWLQTIESIVAHLSVPVIVKEVGFGMSRETIQALLAIGVDSVDVSGRGGTNFAQIENARQATHALPFLNDWGQSTVISLLEASTIQQPFTCLASGGIRHALDIVKALSLGASAVGISGLILQQLLTTDVAQTVAFVQQLKEDVRLIYALLGAQRTAALLHTDLILSDTLISWCDSRNIPYHSFASRLERK